ncbi:MAG: nucleotide exchange factor GrpE [Candidatus Magnetomorum sp.]|nr:nucleotide exchange factor GrpE [Candidatus Magnetomorum sp.]
MTSKPNDAVRVTLSKDSKEISEKQKHSQDEENVIEAEITSENESEKISVTGVKAQADSSQTEQEEEQDISSEATEKIDKIEPEPDDPETALKKKQKEVDNIQDRLLRLSAEFENFKKRNRREMSDFKKFASEILIKDLLPVVDNLDRALETTNVDDTCKAIFEGVSMTRDEMLKIFSKYGVQSIEAIEKPFDPAFHQAVGQEASDECPENTILKEYQKGYTMHGRLLRPSMVVVSKK